MTEEMNEVMVVDNTTTTTSLSPVNVDGAVEFWDNYQELTKALLDESDYQGTQFKKKSAWRKYATAFNLSDDIIKEEEIRDENQQIITSKIWVKCTAPNGRSTVGMGVCSIFDKISKNDHTQPTNFELRKRFSNAEHDIPSTAHTRAKNRAISDMIGAGEVSAEEMSLEPMQGKTRRRKKVQKKTPDHEIVEAQVLNEQDELDKLEAEITKESKSKKTRKTKAKKPKTEEKEENIIIDVDVTAGDWLKKIKDHIKSRGIEANDENIKQCIESFLKKGEFDEEMKSRILKQL